MSKQREITARQRKWRAAKPDKVAEYGRRACQRKWRTANPDKVAEYGRRACARRALKRDEINAKARAKHAANRDAINAKARAWRAAHPANVQKYQKRARAWLEAHPEKVRKYNTGNRPARNSRQREWRAANRDHVNSQAREYHAARRDEYNSRQRARIAAESPADRAIRLAKRRADRASSPHREARIAREKEIRTVNRDARNAKVRTWRAAHPEKVAEYKANAKARRVANREACNVQAREYNMRNRLIINARVNAANAILHPLVKRYKRLHFKLTGERVKYGIAVRIVRRMLREGEGMRA